MKNTKSIIAVIVVLLIVIGIAIYHHDKKKDAQKNNDLPKPVSVTVQKPIQQSLTTTADASGVLVAKKSTVITPEAGGYIRKIAFHEGDIVKKNTVLFELDSQTQKNALTAAKAAYDLSKVEFDRDAQFLKKGFITQDLYYSAKATLKQNQATLQEAKTNLANRTILAPFDGTAGSLAVSVGDYVTPGTKLTTLVDNKHLRVEYTLPVKKLNALKLNQTVIVTDANKKNKITAHVSYISPAVNQSTQTVSVHAKINNTQSLFKPGEYVSVSQQLAIQKNTLLVPNQSVLASINGYHVYVVKNNKAVKVSVKIGERIGSNVVIIDGLQPNDQVITAGENEVKNGANVTVIRNPSP